ncbi:uncharacterized protein LOC119741513 [Patiria miniata]|uniref:ZP domain-containing protein n=1 Tax=Patiria miniata TaxID=46514 RepID=A0A914BB25_PATMI|nr:uncharacterized protein LOC119741513 [Patiria miniata]
MLRDCFLVALLLMAGSVLTEGTLGYYEGGTVFWEARNPDNPREITVDFELNFDARRNSGTHHQCTEESIRTHKKLRTGGQFIVGNDKMFADYYCVKLDPVKQTATGYYNLTYTLPPGESTAQISYTECCWIDGIGNNGGDIGTGKGWNLASTINIAHKDGVSINSPPQSKTFAKYAIMSGCTYSMRIANDDANNDVVKCRWASKKKNECNVNALDICGVTYFDEGRKKPVASLDKESCDLTFGEEETIPPGTYAFMVMLEDFAPNKLKKPMSKTPVHFLMDVFHYEGDCRQPQLHVPRMCFAHVLGEEFQMRIVATATAPNYRITSIDVQGYPTDAPSKVSGTDSDYDIIFTFMPRKLKTYTICVLAYEDERFISSQSCFTVNVVQTEPPALRVDQANSIPAKGDQEAEAIVPNWAIKFDRTIRKGVFSPAYVTLRDSNNDVVWRVDATGPDAEIVGETLTFPNSQDVYLEYEAEYTISLDEGVVQSNDKKCSVKSKPSEWSFVTGVPEPTFVILKPVCSVSSMTMFLPKLLLDLGDYGPEIMHLRDPQCQGVNFNDTHYYVWTSYGLCGTTFQRNGTDYMYSNTIYIPEAPYSPAGTKVTRVPHREIHFSCSIPAKTTKTLTFDPSPGTIGHEEFNGRADFLDNLADTTLKLFNANYDQAYGELSKPLKVPFDTRLYFEGEASCDNRQCDAFFQSCWATTSENPYNWPRHELIKGGCIQDNTLTVHETGVSNKVRFSVDAFAFLGWRIRDTVYVHCNVFVCSSSDNSSICKQGCLQTRAMTSDGVSRRDFMSVVSSPGLIRQ